MCPIEGCEFEGEDEWLLKRHVQTAHSPQDRHDIDLNDVTD